MNPSEPFLVRPFEPEIDEYDDIAAVQTRATPLFPVTADDVQAGDAMRPPHHRRHRRVAVRDGRIVGVAHIGHSLWAYSPDQYMVLVSVDPPHQRLGIGTALHGAALDALADRERVMLRTEVAEDDPAAMAFCVRLGYGEEGRTRMVRLAMEGVDPARLRGAWEAAEAEGFRFLDLDAWCRERGREEGLRAAHALEIDIEADIPHPEGTPFSGPAFDHWCRVIATSPRFRHDAYWLAVAPDGSLAAMSSLLVPASGGIAETALTGVRRAWRRRGLARALKQWSIAWAVETGLSEIRTENAEENAAMRAINAELGFAPMPTRVGFRRCVR